ncbi:DUF4291 domain-containing protein [Micromonospora sonneratiae]|uniref:DUF4291 domain-containing protein n=1 Tax=Micromonospora sonneratiae TaxID=1184706 RepID=A0ABW3YJ77_9ACTN
MPAYRQIRASYDDSTVTVYQAYPPHIAVPTVEQGRFPTWYNRDRMTWIKPSFRWMMYRSGWATKPGQERVLAIRILRSGFEWALTRSALSHFEPKVHASREAWRQLLREAPVRIQWDPERDLHFAPLPYRAIQVGLSGPAVHRYVDEWVTAIEDVTDLAHRVHGLVRSRDLKAAQQLLPGEQVYPVPPAVAAALDC